MWSFILTGISTGTVTRTYDLVIGAVPSIHASGINAPSDDILTNITCKVVGAATFKTTDSFRFETCASIQTG